MNTTELLVTILIATICFGIIGVLTNDHKQIRQFESDCASKGGVIMLSYPQMRSCVSKDYLLLPQL